MEAGFPPLSSVVLVLSCGRRFARQCASNPDSPAASAAFGDEIKFFPADLPVGLQKQGSV